MPPSSITASAVSPLSASRIIRHAVGGVSPNSSRSGPHSPCCGDLAGLKKVFPCQDVLADCRAAVDLVALELCRRTDQVVASVTDWGQRRC